MDKQPRAQQSVEWNYVSIPKRKRLFANNFCKRLLIDQYIWVTYNWDLKYYTVML